MVPPPACLDATTTGYKGKGYKGKGKGKGKKGGFLDQDDDGEAPMLSNDGLIVSNIPIEFNTLVMLHRHFRAFGEVVKITSQAEEGRAFVQFNDPTAAQAATMIPVFGRPDIALSWAPRPPKGTGRSKGTIRKREEDVINDGRRPENRVLVSDPEEARRLETAKRRKDEIAVRRAQLLGELTNQLKVVMAKLTDESISEAKKEALKALLKQLREKLDSFSGPGPGDGAPGQPGKAKGKGKGKSRGPDGEEEQAGGNRFVLDLRTKVLRVQLDEGWTLDRLKDELRKSGVGDDQVTELKSEVEDAPAIVFVRFKDRWAAEQLLNHRSDLPFQVEWSCTDPGEET